MAYLRVQFGLVVIGVANVVGLDSGLGRLPPLGYFGFDLNANNQWRVWCSDVCRADCNAACMVTTLLRRQRRRIRLQPRPSCRWQGSSELSGELNLLAVFILKNPD